MKSKKKRNNDKRVNIILVCIIIVLLALLIVVVATKTNKGQMKDKRPVPSRELYESITGKWYQKDKNEDVYINIRDINRALMHFDFKSGIEFVDQQCLNKTEDRGPYPVETDSARYVIGKPCREQRQAVQQDITEAINACCQKLLLQNGCDVFSIEEYLRNTQSPLYDRRENMCQLLRNADYRIQIET